MWFVDIEVFKYDWLMVAINPIAQQEVVIVNNTEELKAFYEKNKKDVWVMFNGRNYDQYIIKAILLGFNPKKVNDWIILKKRKGWEYSSLFHKVPLIFYDVMPNPPVGLKALEGFLGKNIHETDVSFDIDRKLTQSEIEETIGYCHDDVVNTIEVFLKRKTEFDAQLDLLKAFDFPLKYLGKTQAQLAAVILDAKKMKFHDEWNIRVPDNIQLGKYSFLVDWFLDESNHHYKRTVPTKNGKSKKEEKVHLDCMIAGLEHTFAWGGAHGGGKFWIECSEDEVIIDADAGQLYPNIMRHYGLLSRAARKPEMLEYVLDTSMRLKAEGKKKEREPYKRQCNIFYGAEGDKTNPLYDPLHRNLVCVFGQLFIVDLIEKIEDIVELINSNTDGIFFKVKKKDIPELNRRIQIWEQRTKLKMEYDEYVKFISKDVNNYVAITATGKAHAKGMFVKDLSPLDYDLAIVNRAVRRYLIDGIVPEITIDCCDSLLDFQKIVKLSDKFEWVEHEQTFGNVRYENKAYRVFASKRQSDGRLLKCKRLNGLDKKDKFGNTPDKCFIENSDITRATIPDHLDKDYYVNLAWKRIKAFGG